MPSYTYACGACEHQFVEFQSIHDKPLKKCPNCGKLKLERLIKVAPAVHVKGKEPRTVGELAARRTDAMSKNEYADRQRNANINHYKKRPNLEKPDSSRPKKVRKKSNG